MATPEDYPASRGEYPEGNAEVLSRGPCPNCPTDKGNVTYADGHSHCFSCGLTGRSHKGAPAGAPATGSTKTREGLIEPAPDAYRGKGLAKRGLKPDTLRRFGYFLAERKGQTIHVAPYYDQDGEVAAQKLRYPDKTFQVLKASATGPGLGSCRLFGQQVWGDRFDRRVVVTEGELDAMSVAQATDEKFAVVSVNNGAKGAKASLQANYLWLDRFQEIVLWFDADEPGQQAAAECASLFKIGKVRTVSPVDGAKDASDLLQQGRPGDILQAIYAANAYRPKGIVNAASNEDDVCSPKEGEDVAWSYHWPWPEADAMLGPMKPGQVCYHVAGTGIGKTTGVAEIEHHLLGQGCKIAHMGFEDTRRDVKLRLLSVHTSKRLDIEPLPDADMRALHREVFGSQQVELFDPETAEWTVDAILGYVRYAAKALDCRVIFLDPLTFIAAGLELGDDERRALDKASRDLAAMAKELGVCLQVTHHLKRPEGTAHEEGAQTSINQVRGSGGIANFATFVIGHERNQQAPGDGFLVTQLRVLKNRPRSTTGPMVVLKYDLGTGRLLPTQEEFPGPSSTSRGGRGKGFPPIDDHPSHQPHMDY